MSELTFQVAMRMAGRRSARVGRCRVHQDEQQLGLAGQLAADRGPTGPLAGPGRHPAQGHLELEQVTGDHLATEPGPLDPAEQRELAGDLAGSARTATPPSWASASTISTPGKRGPAREVPGEEGLLAGQPPIAGGRLAGLDRQELGDEEERVAMGQVVLGSHDWRGYRLPREAGAPGIPAAG